MPTRHARSHPIEQLRRRWRICISTNRTKLLEPPLTINTLATWHELVQSRNVKGLASLLIHQKMAAMLQANQ